MRRGYLLRHLSCCCKILFGECISLDWCSSGCDYILILAFIHVFLVVNIALIVIQVLIFSIREWFIEAASQDSLVPRSVKLVSVETIDEQIWVRACSILKWSLQYAILVYNDWLGVPSCIHLDLNFLNSRVRLRNNIGLVWYLIISASFSIIQTLLCVKINYIGLQYILLLYLINEVWLNLAFFLISGLCSILTCLYWGTYDNEGLLVNAFIEVELLLREISEVIWVEFQLVQADEFLLCFANSLKLNTDGIIVPHRLMITSLFQVYNQLLVLEVDNLSAGINFSSDWSFILLIITDTAYYKVYAWGYWNLNIMNSQVKQ